jgi:single-stranded-DNA-specific exonuclease
VLSSLRYQLGKFEYDGFNPIVSILKNRGIEDIEEFINPTGKYVESTSKFKNMEFGKDLIDLAVKNHHKIAVLFDCDVDGFTSGAIVYQMCLELKLETEIILHNGKEHGLDSNTMIELEKIKPNLLIIPDAGSNDSSQIEKLLENNMNVLILDHHEVEENTSLRRCYFPNNTDCFESVIINNQAESDVIDKAMTGVGVVYKFIQYLQENGYSLNADDFLDLVAVGMVADVCDLKQLQSRYYVNCGIEQIQNRTNKNKFIKLLFEEMSKDTGKLNYTNIAFNFVPIMNSLIRFGTLEDKQWLALAICNSDKTIVTSVRGKGKVEITCQEYAYKLCKSYHTKQKKLVTSSRTVFSEQIKKFNLDKASILICNGEDMEVNSLGLMSTNLANKYKKPTIIMRQVSDEYYSGSARGFKTKDFKEICTNIGLFDTLLGHANAFGVTIRKDNISKLYDTINTLKIEPFTHDIEHIFMPIELNPNIIKSIIQYDDLWGCGVDSPKFLIENIPIGADDFKILGNSQDTICFTYNGIKYIKFQCGIDEVNKFTRLACDNSITLLIDVICTFKKNKFGGRSQYQVIVEEMDLDIVPF